MRRQILPNSLPLLLAAATLLLPGCVASRAFRHGDRALAERNLDLALEYYRQAFQKDPENVRYRFALGNAVLLASGSHLKRGDEFDSQGEYKAALIEYEKALAINPENNEARRKKLALLKKVETLKRETREKTDIEKIKEQVGSIPEGEPALALKSNTYSLIFKQDMDVKALLGSLQVQSGIQFIYDEGFQSKKVQANFEGSFREVLEKILMQTKLFYKIVDESTVIIVPDTPAKRSEYDELVMRTFFLSNAEPEPVKKLVADVTGIKILSINQAFNSITLRDSPKKVEMAEKLIRALDKPRAEMLIDIEIVEVNRTRLKQYGIELSQYQVSEVFSPEPLVDDAAPPVRANIFRSINASDFLFTFPSVAYKLLASDSTTRIKAHPQTRVVDQQTVKLLIGDRIPIPTTTFVSRYGGQSQANDQPITSFTMQDIGIIIELQPRVHHDGWITITLKFELIYLTGRISETIPPTLGNRKVETVIRLQDNETGILAGLVRDTERRSLKGLPGLSSLPILKSIFGSNDNEISQTEIILSITPRIIRHPDIDESDILPYWVGTEKDLGLRRTPPPAVFKPKASEKPGEKEQKKEETKKTDSAKPKPQVVMANGHLIASGEPFSMARPFSVGLSVDVVDLRTLEAEVEFDPAAMSLLAIEEGAGAAGAHLFKTIDAERGRTRIVLSLEKGATAKSELATLRCQALKAGPTRLLAKSVRVTDGSGRIYDVPDIELPLTVSGEIK